ncbi:MAG: hypothetical protein GTN64_02460, partial [Candidatus Latescibacteria bacterium]|nr:hypothetical protein [Candidatus Latescibacterota bacterium]NIO77480.1 hypothetical protein [Candidatus Latescibacterota bacterium]
SQMFFFEQLPRNPVGKIDRLALAAGVAEKISTELEYVAPTTANEKIVADAWKQELSLRELGVHQDFASVDGDSLSAVRILLVLEARFGGPMPDDIVSNFSTVFEIARRLDKHGFMAVDETSPEGGNRSSFSEAA